MLPRGRLIVLPGIGHMLHHAAPGIVIEAIDELAGTNEWLAGSRAKCNRV